MTTTFATPIDEAPCEHNWQHEDSDWLGDFYKCLYCPKTNWIKHEINMQDCQISV